MFNPKVIAPNTTTNKSTINNALPILNLVYLLSILANISVPPVDAFVANAIARPVPIIKVPNTTASAKLVDKVIDMIGKYKQKKAAEELNEEKVA